MSFVISKDQTFRICGTFLDPEKFSILVMSRDRCWIEKGGSEEGVAKSGRDQKWAWPKRGVAKK